MPDRDATKSYSLEARVGRLIEARVFGLRTREEVDAYAVAAHMQVLRMPAHVRPVLCADHRPVYIYNQDVADRLMELFQQMNSRLERIAILVARSNATLVLQLERLVREASFSSRKLVFAPEEAEAHLAPILDTAELARLRAFVGEYVPRG
jgi:hypothetical protein